MREQKISILHISDLHFGNSKYDDNVETLAIKICNDLKKNNNPIEKIIVTGDIIDGKGHDKKKKYNEAKKFLKSLKEKLNQKFASKINEDDFIIVPGNHDTERSESDIFSSYKKFLNDFHGDNFNSLYDSKYLYTKRIFKNQKIVILGFNSCMIKPENFKELSWIEKVNLSKILSEKQKKDLLHKLHEEKKKEWDDYGEISAEQLDQAFSEINDEINISDYRILVVFHHHFYPFPETYGNFGDKSMIRNFWNVSQFLSENNTQIVLHGHKHVSIKRLVPTEKYFSNSNSMMYVFSAGCLGHNSSNNMNYQVLDVYSPDNYSIAKLLKYDYTLEELTPISPYYIPPQQTFEKVIIELLELLKREKPLLHEQYLEVANNNISVSYQVEKIIQNISISITQFDDVRNRLKNNPKLIYLILLIIHYRIVIIDQIREKKIHETIIDKLEKQLANLLSNEDYKIAVLKFIASAKNEDFLNNYKKIENKYSNISAKYKEMTSFITVVAYLTDIFLTLGKFGDFYYEKEGIEHKVNIKLSKETQFKDHLPLATISLESDIERRCANISFECTDPTVHKIAVLILKDFEDRINTIEESFKEIGLKIYYIRPRISIKGNEYDLENLNFEAYIPTLLPLLTGENLYKNREVFIRELIQNSLDAILLRYEIEKENEKQGNDNDINFDKTIYISMGEEKNVKGENRKFVRVRDHGIGMDKFKIERYFTSIGRSFYVSKEFKELQDDQNITYKPVSNFGIGFLSAFMVCKEIKVLTKNIEATDDGLEIEVPNYDGCFFVKKASGFEGYGTEITLYEEEDENSNRKINFERTRDYIAETIRDLQLDIHLKIKHEHHAFEAFGFRKVYKKTPRLFIPFKENGIKKTYDLISDKSFENDHPFGLLVIFETNKDNEIVELNEGIKLSGKPKSTFINPAHICRLIYNFPSSYIQLDVSREEIKEFKEKEKKFLEHNTFKKDLSEQILKQSLSLIQNILKKRKNQNLSLINNIYTLVSQNSNSELAASLKKLKQNVFILEIDINNPFSNYSLIPYSKRRSDDYTIQITPNIKESFISYKKSIQKRPWFESNLEERYREMCKEFEKSVGKIDFIIPSLYRGESDFGDLIRHFDDEYNDNDRLDATLRAHIEYRFKRICEEFQYMSAHFKDMPKNKIKHWITKNFFFKNRFGTFNLTKTQYFSLFFLVLCWCRDIKKLQSAWSHSGYFVVLILFHNLICTVLSIKELDVSSN